MEMKHSTDPLQSAASQDLREFLRARGQVGQQEVSDFEQFERELHEHIGFGSRGGGVSHAGIVPELKYWRFQHAKRLAVAQSFKW